ncbi:ATP-binding cassette domain-containing protein [[Pseudopropionibacterium] massiliense]|uniref:ATP-binding cassette domain-containing protein n=1 Tax=[Pseudopropionibacterium] massiliense TaxID=2220000 RepID=UPI001A936B71|nr:ATP-binding cassette domain-containing protein [[Pseudopropionibacterium] massiliense]
MILIEISRVTRRFGEHQVLREVSFEVPAGAVTGFVGPNGAGKTTLLRIVAGLDQPDGGQIIIDGTPLPRGAARTNLGVLLDAGWVHPSRTAHDHLRALALMQDVPRSRVDEILELTGLHAVSKRRAGTFSLGMKQRLGIAAALLTDPGNVVLDEPVNGLDPDGVTWVRNLVRMLSADGTAVLMSSHLLSEMAQTADRVVVIGKGEIISQATMSELTRLANPATLVSATDPTVLSEACRRAGATVDVTGNGLLRISLEPEAIGQIALAAEVALTHMEQETISLEKRFQELTADHVEYRGDLIAARKEES